MADKTVREVYEQGTRSTMGQWLPGATLFQLQSPSPTEIAFGLSAELLKCT